MKIMEVNERNLSEFNQSVMKGGAVVKYWADWCGHCKELNPKWDIMTNHLKSAPGSGLVASVPEAMMSKVNCDSDVMGYPTIRYLVGGRKRKDYSGPREVENLEKFVTSSLGGGSKKKKKKKKKSKNKKQRKNKTKRKRKKRRKNNKTKKKRKNKSRSALRDRFFKMINGNRF